LATVSDHADRSLFIPLRPEWDFFVRAESKTGKTLQNGKSQPLFRAYDGQTIGDKAIISRRPRRENARKATISGSETKQSPQRK